jgi:hypothetical protein
MAEHKRALGENGKWADPGDATPKSAFLSPMPAFLHDTEQVGGIRRFVLDRTADVSGTSGVGIVAEGVAFSDGTCVIRWITDLRSTAVYNSVDDLVAIHGHDGATTVVWADS